MIAINGSISFFFMNKILLVWFRFGSVWCLEHNVLIFAFLRTWEKQMEKTNADYFPPQYKIYSSDPLLFRTFEKYKAGFSAPKKEHKLYMAI